MSPDDCCCRRCVNWRPTTAMPVALTRLAKRLDQRVSVLLRELTALSDARLGGVPGPGLVRLACDDAGRWTAAILPPPHNGDPP